MGFWKNLVSAAWPRDAEAFDNLDTPSAVDGSVQYIRGGVTNGQKYQDGLYGERYSPTLDNVGARQQARVAYIDSLHAHAMVNRFVDSVVDIGLQLKPRPASRVLGITEDQAAEWAEDVGKRFDLWAKSKKVDRGERINFYQMQRLAAICQHRDGEYFIRMHYDGDGANPLQLRVMDPGAICGYSQTPTDGSEFYSDGIRRDSRGRPISYEIIHHNPSNDKVVTKTIAAKGRRSKLPLMLHGFSMEWPSQVRGYPRFLHALQEFKSIADFQESHIRKAIAQSSIAMFVKPSQTAPASNPVADITQDAPSGPGVLDFYSSATDATPNAVIGDNVQYTPIPEATLTDPGSIGVFSLQEGEDLRPFQNTAPAEGYQTFLSTFTTYLAASVGMPQEVLTMKFDQSYSAARGALIMFWRIAQIWRMELMSDLLKPVYEAWLSGEIAAGRVQAPGWSDKFLREAWLNCHWTGVPMPNIDPQKTANADQLYVEMGAQTLQDVAHNFNGSNYEENKAQLIRELEDIPCPPWSEGAKAEAAKEIAEGQKEQQQGVEDDGPDNKPSGGFHLHGPSNPSTRPVGPTGADSD